MGKKRKQDPGRDDSSSSDAKRCRSCHCQNGETSRPNDGMPPREGLADIVRAVIELKEVMQVKLSTEEKFKSKIKKLKEKRKKDKNKHEEDLRVLKADLRKLKKNQKELKFQIQEMRKEECAEVNHYKASPCQRSQPSQSTKFRLVIENSMRGTIYKKETVETEDGGGHIKVVMYDGGNPIASDHRLASVRVELVVIEGGFDEKRDSWSKEEFEESIIKPRRTTSLANLVKNGTFNLIGGSCDHEGAIIMDNSQQREVKLGVRITVPTETRVLEGVSNPFKVQEGKTKKLAPNKNGNKPSPPVRTRNLRQPTRNQATQHDDNGPAIVPQMVEKSGHAQNTNGQQSCQHISYLPTSTRSMQQGLRTGQNYGLPSTSIPNQLQAAGYCEQDQYTNFLDAVSPQIACPELLNDFCQWTSTPTELGLPSQSIGEISVEDVHNSNVRTQIQETSVDAPFRCYQVLLQWDKPQVELKKHWNFLDQLTPLYSTQSRFYRESFPSTSLMDKAHKLLPSISSGDSVLKMLTSVTSGTTKTPQRRGVLIQPIEPYDSDDGPQVKKQTSVKYQLCFVNRVCNDYYTREQIKSEDRNPLKVALYDENNLVVTSGPLSSASVEIVLLHGDFNDDDQDYWTSEEFSACLVHPQSVKEPSALGGDRVLALTEGEANLGNVYFQTSSSHARTGKFKMGVKIKYLREESVQEGITSPFLVRVRQGEESSHHRITSLEALLRVKVKLSKQEVCDARENAGASSAMHDQSSQVRSILGASKVEDHEDMVRTASDRPPEWFGTVTLLKDSDTLADRFWRTASDGPLERFTKWRRELQLLSTEKNKDADYSTAMDGGVIWQSDPDSAAMSGGVIWQSDPFLGDVWQRDPFFLRCMAE